MIHFAFRVMGRVLGNWPPIPPQSDYPPEVAKRLPKPSDVSRRNRKLQHLQEQLQFNMGGMGFVPLGLALEILIRRHCATNLLGESPIARWASYC